MAITVTVNAVDKTNTIDWTSIRKEEVLTKEADTLTFEIKNYGTKTYRPSLGDEVILYDGATKKFGGYVVELNEKMGGLAKFLEVIVKDYTQTLDRQLVSKTYTSQTAGAIISDIISTFTTGFTTTNVNATTIIPKIIFNYLTVSQCLQKLSEVLGNFDWYVDYNKDIHFFNNSIISSPFNLTDTSGNYVFESLQLHDETHQIRNEIIIRGGEITSTTLRTEYFSGDGTKTNFPLGNKFANLPTVIVGGITQTVGVDYIDKDASFQCMWNFNEKYIRFTAGNIPPAGTNNISVAQYPLYPLVFRKQNQTSVALYGVYQYLIYDKTIKDLDTASQRANAELLKYANPTKKGKFVTKTSGLVSGQTITVQSTIRGVSQTYKIQSITTALKTPNDFIYEIDLVTADDIGINDVLNKLLVKDVADQIQVDENEVVARYYSFSESLLLSDTIYTPTKTSPPYKWTSGTTTLVWNFGTWG